MLAAPYEGLFSVRILSGLVRVGWVADEASADAVGTDETSFGFGGTGKTPSCNMRAGRGRP